MLVEEDVYLEHYGKQGMRWGQRRALRKALNKSHTKLEKTAVATASIGAGLFASGRVFSKTMNTNLTSATFIASAVATKKLADKIINEHGTTKISSLKA